MARQNRNSKLIEKIFFDNYKKGVTKIEFKREDITDSVAFPETPCLDVISLHSSEMPHCYTNFSKC